MVLPLTFTTISTCVPPPGPNITRSPTFGLVKNLPCSLPQETWERQEAVNGKSVFFLPPALMKAQQVKVAHHGWKFAQFSSLTSRPYLGSLFLGPPRPPTSSSRLLTALRRSRAATPPPVPGDRRSRCPPGRLQGRSAAPRRGNAPR